MGTRGCEVPSTRRPQHIEEGDAPARLTTQLHKGCQSLVLLRHGHPQIGLGMTYREPDTQQQKADRYICSAYACDQQNGRSLVGAPLQAILSSQLQFWPTLVTETTRHSTFRPPGGPHVIA